MNGERILIVEDEKIIAFDLHRRLRSFGFDVIGHCTNGQEAIEICSRERPDLVLMDIMLEGPVDGIEASKIILEKFQVPSVFLTAYSDEATLERAKAAQPLAYIIKPFKERELYSTLDMALYKSKFDAKLKDQERWMSAILNSVGDGIIALNLEQRVHYVNPVAAAILGYPQSELIGKQLKSFFILLDEESLIPIKLIEDEDDRESTIFFKKALLQVNEGVVYHVEGSVSRVRFERFPVGQVITLRDISPLRRMSERLEFQSKHDALTGLLNRKEFTAKLTELHQNKVLKGIPCAMLYLDLDQFKLVNDTCGHLAGDELLRQAGDLLKQMRDSKVAALARLGGDEFGILFEDCPPDASLEKAWILKHNLNNHEFVWQNTSFKIKASLGLIPIDPQYEDVKTILAAADDACYMAKEEGGNRIKVYELQDDSFQKRRGEMTWIAKLTKALESNRFLLYQQPIVAVDPASKLRDKIEILLRLSDVDDKIIPPSDFIPAAERYNLMPQLDRWVIKSTVAQFKEFQRVTGKNPMFCVNLSGESIADTNLISFIKHEFKKNEVNPEDFCFEITETATIANLTQAITFIKDLKSIGCAFALDDFGSGFSSFAYLKNLPVDFLKIDGAFIKTLDQDPVNFAMVEAMEKISRVMGLKTIAEFVASDSVLHILRAIGIDYAQGYAIAKPQPLFDR